jgi:fatty-acyl-CoA synthase
LPIPHFDWIEHHACRSPERLAAIDIATGRRLTYAVLHQRVARLAGYLRDSVGIHRGDRIAVLARNSTDLIEIQFAAARLAAIYIPLNWRLAPAEVDAILQDAAPKLLICDDEFRPVAAYRDRGLPLLSRSHAYEEAIAVSRPLAGGSARLIHDDIAFLIYTSGTTGLPKGVVVTHGMTFWNAVNMNYLSLTQFSVGLTVLPMFHTSGLNSYANSLLHVGGTVTILDRFDAGVVLSLLSEQEPAITHFHAVPAILQALATHFAFAKANLTRLMRVCVGGAPVPISVLHAWSERGVDIIQGFGMTEASPGVLSLPIADAKRKAGSVGKPVLHVETRVVTRDGRDAKPSETGELWIRGPAVSPGYWNKPELTHATFRDGWLRTGDAVQVDEEGYFYVVDRWKDMYISGGENVYPAEVERILDQIPGVAEAAVFGVPDGTWGESGYAVVVPEPGCNLSEGDILAYCRSRLARFKVPRTVRFADALPRTAAGKIHKPSLRALHSAPASGTLPQRAHGAR